LFWNDGQVEEALKKLE